MKKVKKTRATYTHSNQSGAKVMQGGTIHHNSKE